MRTLILLLLFATSQIQAESNYSIVFLHIGEEIPAYAKTALSQARLFNPNCQIIMLANACALKEFSMPAESAITYITAESLSRGRAHEAFCEKTTLNSEWRNGFWKLASERFLYLGDLIAQHKLKNVFHLENDNMLYVNLEELMPLFNEKYQGIGAAFDTDDRAVPGMIYFADERAALRLSDCFAAHARKGLNDMAILGKFKRENSAEFIANIPVVHKEYVKDHQPLVPIQGKISKDAPAFCSNVDRFNSIFDANALGQYVDGIDPRNGPSEPGYINLDCIFDVSKLEIEWLTDSQGRRIPFAIYQGKKLRVNNMHVHSKRLDRFKSIGAAA